MTCRNCGAELRPGAKFCDQCGTQTASSCATCGAELRPGAKFCDECGAAQSDVALAAAPATTAKAPSVQRKVTSVLFGDLVAFTTLSERNDKEDVRDLLSRYFEQCRQIVSRYGGTIEKFIGDAVMAVWGVPAAHEDDAERAVRAGLELVRAIETLGEELGLPELAMRVGIVTDEVAVTVGAEHEGMVAGDPVNTAARVQSIANPGEVWVDESTRLLTSGAITYVDVGSHQLKGKADPIPLWAVRAVVASVGGAQRADGLEAPLTGRGRELRVIKELFHGIEENGRPALVIVSGDPGLGKSRLGWELEKYIDGLTRTVAWHSTRCLAYGDGVAFWPIAEAVRGRLGIVETDVDADPATALDLWLARRVPDESEAAWLRARVLALLGRESSGGYDREDLFTAWQTFLERAGDGDPVALLIDDAQHADEGTVSFVEHVLANSDAPLFVMLLTRPELLQRWPDLVTNRRGTVLHLATLENREMAALLDGLVTGLPEEVRDGLAERAQGVPLYAIETVRSLIDRDLVVPRGGVYVLPDATKVDLAAIGAPASLHALVAARLDGLPENERRVVAEASVLGATFSRDAIGVLAADVPDLDAVLAALAKAEIFSTVMSRLSAEYGQFRFVQDVVRQVAYSTQARRDRKGRHLAVAAYLESLPDPGGDFAPVLAQHYLDAIESSGGQDADVAELRERVVGHLRGAAARAEALGAHADALRYLDIALSHVDADQGVAASLHLDASKSALEAADAERAETHAQMALDYFDRAGDRLNAGDAAAVIGLSKTTLRGDNAAAIDIAGPHWEALHDVRGAEPVLLPLVRALILARSARREDVTELVLARIAIAEAIGDRATLADALNNLGYASLRRAPTLSRTLFRASAEIAVENQRPNTAAKALLNIAVMDRSIDLAACAELVEVGTEQLRKLGGDVVQFAILGMNGVLLTFVQGDWNAAEEWLDATAVADLTPTKIVVAWLDALLADARGRPRRFPLLTEDLRATDDEVLIGYVDATDMYDAKARGDLRAAVAHGLASARRQMDLVGIGDDLVFVWPPAVECALAADDADGLAQLLAIIDEFPAGLVTRAFTALRLRYAALLAMRGEGTSEVEPTMRRAIAMLEEWGSPVYAARSRAELGNWLDRQGRPEDAAVLRQDALAVLQRVGANGWLAELGLEAVPIEAG
ncbi:MAG TPA: adenylate/guanylate cyclase domain-containing protein [Jatrophihabitantaceae bacterium]|nr:adenylate/guanylate cyclase domain-containing protein [Jatrophihabitantaceae bacterium]